MSINKEIEEKINKHMNDFQITYETLKKCRYKNTRVE